MRYLFILFCLCSLHVNITQAKSSSSLLTVPFQNIPLVPGGSLIANYSFGPFSLLFCFNNTTTNEGVISWTFNGISRSINLPVFLITNAKFDGEFADPTGFLTITNNVNKNLVVGCLFGF